MTTGMYKYEKPKLPFLHRCKNCHKRLNKGMDCVKNDYSYLDIISIDWYCSKECAREELEKERNDNRKNMELIKYLNGEQE